MLTSEQRAAVDGINIRLRRVIQVAEADLGAEAAWPVTSHVLEAIQACDEIAARSRKEQANA